ncbi:TPA: hypothetical protein ACWV58_005205, partial [Salmonella enterica subsp. enterica serovar Muenchen]
LFPLRGNTSRSHKKFAQPFSVFSYLFRKRREGIKFILLLSGPGQRATRGVSQEACQTGPPEISEYIRD